MNALSSVSLPMDVIRTPHLDDGARQEKALKELEGVFLHLLLKEMRKSVPEGGLLGDSPAQKMFQEMLDEVYAQKMADSGQLGIAKSMADQIALQGKQREVREAVLNAGSGEMMPIRGRSGPPEFFEVPQVGFGAEFMPVKSQRPGADKFPVDDALK